MKNTRESNLELLRIIAMLMITMFHYAIYSGFNFPVDTITFNKLLIDFMKIGGKIGVNIFVLISGYFLIKSKENKISKLLRLWFQILFYSVIIYLIAVCLKFEDFTLVNFIKCFLPVTFRTWWFASTYFVLYMIYPYLNKLLNSLNQSQYKKMLLFLTICWCLIQTFTNQNFEGNDLLWFIYVYSIAGYIRLWGGGYIKNNSKKFMFMALLLIFLTYMSSITFNILGLKFSFFAKNATYFFNTRKINILVISILLFLGFSSFKFYNKKINFFASMTFSIYLIQENPLLRPIIWQKIFKSGMLINSPFLLLNSLIVVLIVMMVSFLIEYLRIIVFEKSYLDRLRKIELQINKIIDYITNSKIYKSL